MTNYPGNCQVIGMSVKCKSKSVQGYIASRKFFYLVMLATAGLMMTSKAWAHRDRGPDDPCRRQLGASLLHLTLYQPQFNPDAEYCDEVPRAGKTVMVVDMTAGELREAPMSLEVIAASDSGQARTVLSVPPKIYERGIVDTEVILDEGNDYVARVMVDLGAGKEPQLLSFPIQVAAWYRAMMMPALLVVGVLAFIIISVIRYQVAARQQESSVGRINVRRVAN